MAGVFRSVTDQLQDLKHKITEIRWVVLSSTWRWCFSARYIGHACSTLLDNEILANNAELEDLSLSVTMFKQCCETKNKATFRWNMNKVVAVTYNETIGLLDSYRVSYHLKLVSLLIINDGNDIFNYLYNMLNKLNITSQQSGTLLFMCYWRPLS